MSTRVPSRFEFRPPRTRGILLALLRATAWASVVPFLLSRLEILDLEGSRAWWVALPLFLLVFVGEVRRLLDRIEITESGLTAVLAGQLQQVRWSEVTGAKHRVEDDGHQWLLALPGRVEPLSLDLAPYTEDQVEHIGLLIQNRLRDAEYQKKARGSAPPFQDASQTQLHAQTHLSANPGGSLVDPRPRRACPFCAELIPVQAVLCRFCNRSVTPVPSLNQ